MIKAIIFDCFGVLVGSGYWNVYRSLGGDPVKDAGLIDQSLKAIDIGNLSQLELRDRMAEHLGISPEAYMAAYNKDELPNPELFAYIRDQLRPTYKLAIVSNAGPGIVEKRIPPELRALFDVVIVSGDVGLLKPDPAIFRLAVEGLDVPPEHTVFIDDHAPYLLGAESIGMHTILYKGFSEFTQKLSKLIG